jgi:ParB-like chromosome segregation protein Spo0J
MAKKKITVPMVNKIELWEVGRLRCYAKNTNKHPEEQITKIAASIREFGFIVPIVIRGAEIAAGEGRYKAALRLGLESVPVIFADHLTEEQFRMFVIADNRLARDSFLDEHLLAMELADLRDGAGNLNVLGFTEDEMKKLIGDGSAPSSTIGGMDTIDDEPASKGEKVDDPLTDELIVIAHCTSFKQQLDVLNTLRGLGVLCETKGKKKVAV